MNLTFQSGAGAPPGVGRVRSPPVLLAIGGMTTALVLMMPSSAIAADEVLARDSATHMWALDGTVVYDGSWGWMRIVHGRVRQARRLPADILGGGIGRDRGGRVVMTYATDRLAGDGTIQSRRWWIYDVATDRARRVRGLAGPRCLVEGLAVWGSRMAYSTRCGIKRAVFLRSGSRTRKLAPEVTMLEQDGLVLRGSTLAGMVDRGEGDSSVWLLADASGVCSVGVPGASGTGDGVHPTGLWVSGGNVSWSMSNTQIGEPVYRTVFTSKLRGLCRLPAPSGRLPFSPLAHHVEAMAIDGGFVYYAGPTRIYRHRLPASPSAGQ